MQRKKLSFLALVALATLGLASCKEEVIEEEKNPGYEYGGKVNVYLNYNGQNGISYQETDPYYNRVDKITYTRGDLLPTWSAFSKNCNLDIKDVASYSEKKDDDVYKVVEAKNFTGTDGSNIDLFYNSVGNIKKMASNGTALDLLPYLQAGKMPHFKAYLDKNPEVLEMCVLYDDDGKQHLYYTPYFDGYQQIERMFIMDTEMVERFR
jgi:putative aldouronate transport system substrate-binding protein